MERLSLKLSQRLPLFLLNNTRMGYVSRAHKFFRAFEYSVSAASIALAGTVIFAFALPLGAAFLPLVTSFAPLAKSVESLSMGGTHMLRIALYTLSIALLSTVVACAVGVCAAFFTANRLFFGRRFLLSLSAVPLCVPPLVIALGFVSVFGVNGIFNKAIAASFHVEPLTFLYSPLGIIIAQGFYNFPLVMLIVSNAWQELGRTELDAARLLGAHEARIFFTVTVHKLSPSIAASCIPVFLYCFFSFMMVLLFGAPGSATLEVEIYRAAKVTLDYKAAAMLALIETCCAMAVVIVYSVLKKSAGAQNVQNAPATTNAPMVHEPNTQTKHAAPFALSGNETRVKIAGARYQSTASKCMELAGALFLGAAILLFFIFPLVGIAAGAVSSSSMGALSAKGAPRAPLFFSHGFRTALRGTCIAAPCTAALCVTSATVYAVFLRMNKRLSCSLALQIIPLVPLAVSSVVVGYGLTAVVTRASVFSLVLAQSSLAWPLAFRIVHAALQAVPQEAVDASLLLSTARIDTTFRILLPSIKRSIASAFCFCFAASAGDATLPLVLAVSKFDTLALYTYRLASSYRFAEACACGMLLCVLCMVLLWATRTE